MQKNRNEPPKRTGLSDIISWVCLAAAFGYTLAGLGGMVDGDSVKEYGCLNLAMWFWYFSLMLSDRKR